jgi:glyoxylase-like metal-dependent hydrolase (beta-lactamase superfamily II)
MLKTSQFHTVTRIDLSRTLRILGNYWTTAYYLDGFMIDTGCAHTEHELIEELRDKNLVGILNTHSHEDHIGANGALQGQNPGIKILAHPLALPVLDEPRKKQPLHPYRRLFWGYPVPSSGIPIKDGELIETERYQLRAIHTPGHSSDHLCFYEEQHGWMFTGDLFVGGKERALRADYDIWGIIASLKRIAELPIEMLFPGSARVREKPTVELRDKISYLEDMGGKVLDLHSKGRGVRSIARELFGEAMSLEVMTLGHFSRKSLVLSYLRHLSI